MSFPRDATLAGAPSLQWLENINHSNDYTVFTVWLLSGADARRQMRDSSCFAAASLRL
jgi:hypothetical protein